MGCDRGRVQGIKNLVIRADGSYPEIVPDLLSFGRGYCSESLVLAGTTDYLVKIFEEMELSIGLIRDYRPVTDKLNVEEYTGDILTVLSELKRNARVSRLVMKFKIF